MGLSDIVSVIRTGMCDAVIEVAVVPSCMWHHAAAGLYNVHVIEVVVTV